LQADNGIYDAMSIPMVDLFSTYSLTSSAAEVNTDNINNYMIGLWFQQNPD